MPEEGGTDRPTLIRPPPDDPDKAPIENVLDVLELSVFGPNIFTNTRPLWHPPGARGVFGGAMIAMCLAAGQKTVPADFIVHSCHCYFILAGSSEIPVMFHVEKVRDGRSYATRTVQARQKGRPIFTTTMSFVKEVVPPASSSAAAATVPNHEFKDNVVRHAAPMPRDPATGDPLRPPPDDFQDDPELFGSGPFQNYRTEVVNPHGAPQTKKLRQWYRARGTISAAGGHQAHLNALAYVSDSYFIGTVSRIHRLWRYPFPADEFASLPPEYQAHVRRLNDFEGYDAGDSKQRSFEEFQQFWRDRPAIGMMVSLDHSIYFHEPRKVKADEWLLSEMESPWAGDGRGVVTQRIFAKDGTLLATCFQEGVVRLQDPVVPEDTDTSQKKAKL